MKQLLKKNKNFRYFWMATSVTTIGDYVDDIALAQLIYIITQSTLVTSYVFAIKIVFTFLNIFTATYIDKHNKRKIIILSSMGQGFVLAILLVLYQNNLINTYILIAFVTLQTIFSTFSVPAQNAILPCIVSESDMLNARSTINIFMQFVQIFSYVCAGAIIGWIGISGAILLDVFTFFASTLIMMLVDNVENVKQKFDSPQEFWGNVKEGFHFVLGEKLICSVILVTFLGNLLASPVDTLMPAYFIQGGYEDYAYAVFMIGIAFGGIIGSWELTKIQDKLDNGKLLSIGFFIGAIGMVILYCHIKLVAYLASVFIGISYGFVSILNATIIQLRTPKEMTARTFSVFKCISYVASPLGIVIAGFIGEFLTMKAVFMTLGILMVCTSILSMRYVKAPVEKNNNIFSS